MIYKREELREIIQEELAKTHSCALDPRSSDAPVLESRLRQMVREEIRKILNPMIPNLMEMTAGSGMDPPTRPEDPSRKAEKLKERLIASGIPVEEEEIDVLDFREWLQGFPELAGHYYLKGRVFIEKCLEHYLTYRYLQLGAGDVYIDIAAAGSPWAPALVRRGVRAYRLDLCYPEGVHGMDVGADACQTGLQPEGVNALSLHCAYECFMGDSDTRFLSEASRILKKGGRLAIVPLYLNDEYVNLTSLLVMYFSKVKELNNMFVGRSIYCYFMFCGEKKDSQGKTAC